MPRLPLVGIEVGEIKSIIHLHSSECTALGAMLILFSVATYFISTWMDVLWFLVAAVAALRSVAGGRSLPSKEECIDVEKKWCVVTGANAGIGLEVVKKLYAENAHVILACRSEARAKKAMADVELSTRSMSGKLHFVQLDLQDPKSISAFSTEVENLTDRIDILVQNAGIVNPGFKLSPYGVESMIAVHAVSPVILFEYLKPLLQKSPVARVVNVSSCAHAIVPYVPPKTISGKKESGKKVADPNTPLALAKSLHGPGAAQAFHALGHVKVYGLSKLLGMYATNCISDGNRWVNATSVHPGLSVTNIFDDIIPSWCAKLVYYPFLLLGKTHAEAARPVLYACLSKEFVRRGYVVDCRDYGDRSGVVQLSRWGMDGQHGWEAYGWMLEKIATVLTKKSD